jgi:hypothetical protein
MSEAQMQNDLTTTTNDGWLDVAVEANQRVLRGTLIRFADWNWTRGKEAELIEKGTQLVATGTAAAWVKWQDGKPVETRLRQPGSAMPEREELGNTDEASWETGPDKRPKDPWQNTRFVYLVDPKTAESFTFSTSSFGGREAVLHLGDAIARMRSMHADAMPVVALEAAPMQTRYGRKSKPAFRITGWKSANGETREVRQLPPQTRAAEMDDGVPW